MESEFGISIGDEMSAQANHLHRNRKFLACRHRLIATEAVISDAYTLKGSWGQTFFNKSKLVVFLSVYFESFLLIYAGGIWTI